MRSAFEFIMSRRRGGNGRRGAIVLVAALDVSIAALLFSLTSAYGVPEANDRLTVNGLGGDDDVAIGRDVAALIQTLVDLGGDE